MLIMVHLRNMVQSTLKHKFIIIIEGDIHKERMGTTKSLFWHFLSFI